MWILGAEGLSMDERGDGRLGRRRVLDDVLARAQKHARKEAETAPQRGAR